MFIIKKMLKLRLIKSSICILLLCSCFLLTSVAISEDEPTGDAGEPQGDTEFVPKVVDMSKRITLDLRNMEVADALKYLSLRSGMNIVTSKSVTGRVTFQLKNVPLQDIFDITLLSNDLACEKIGDIYYVMTAKEYEATYGKQFGDRRVVKVFRLKYAIPEKAFDMLDTLKSKIGKVLVDQETGTVMIMDTPDNIAEAERSLELLEQKGEVSIFNLQYADAKDIEEQLKNQLDNKKLGSIRADARTNQVIVQTLPGRMDDIEEMINSLDKKTKEVLIDTKIIKIKLSDDKSVGFEWEGMFNSMTEHGMNFLGSHPLYPVYRAGKSFIDQYTTVESEDANLPAGNKSTGIENLYFGRTSSAFSFEAMFKFLQTIGETRLLSNPKIAVINNQEARIHVGRREAYITTTTTTGQTTTTTAEEVTFVDIGIQLAVTPTINDEGYITLKIKPEVSSVVDVLTTPSNNEIPIVDTSMAETTVIVKDGSTIIIGGLRREDEVVTNKTVPFFGKIPFLGNLLGSKTTETERTELLVMITPHIVTGDKLVTGDSQLEKDETKPVKEYVAFEPVEEEEAKLQLKSYSSY
jgi:type II secretory pathway component GspD/PulD (secretin)